MKNYFLLLAIIVFILADIFISNAIIANRNINKAFETSGYILKYAQDTEKYYFDQEAKYKNTYNDQVTFKNTDGQKIAVDKTNFIHYDDGSISSFTKGVLLDLDMIDTDPITYYNVSANKVLKKLSNNKYVTKNLDEDILFTNLMWKISDSKYLLASNSIQIVLGDGTERNINGFVEIEYADNEVVKVFNQEVKYETISSEVYLKVGNDIKINLGTKIVSKEDKNMMTLNNMVIDSNDNVTIIDMEEYKEENKDENNTDNNTTTNGSGNQGGNSSSISGGNVNGNGGTTIIGGETGNTEDNNNDDNNNDNNNSGDNDNNQDGGKDTEIEDDLSVYAPKYIITEFETTATGLKATVEIQDDEARLTSGTTTTIISNKTGKVVYSLPETGATEIKIDTSTLEPNTEYTLTMEASYAIDNVNYKKNFIYKVFRTSALGVILEKDLFTDESLAFYIKFEKDSPVTKLDVELLENGQVRQEIANYGGSTERIEFAELTPDTQYTIRVKNIFVDNVSNDDTYDYTYRTLKSIPKLANGKTHCNINTEIDKWNSRFVLTIPDLQEGIVESLHYQVYTETENKQTVVYNTITTDTKIILPINETIQRNKEYYCRVFATFYDNEKVIEYEIANTETSFIMNSSEMPTIRFEPQDITFNSIKGNLIIDDAGNTVNPSTSKVEVVYNSTSKGVDDNGTLTFNGTDENLNIPIEIKELKSNETYKLSVYATYDLHDENGERYGYIGSIMVTTKIPVPMKATWTPQDNGINVNLKLSSTEDSNAEANALYSFELALYLGQEGASKTPIAKAKLVDAGVENFIASLKETYYNGNGGVITKDVFGLSEAQIDEIEKTNKYCTIVLTNAKDYVSRNKNKNFENDLPIISNTISYPIKIGQIKNPTNSQDAIKITQVAKDRLQYTSATKVYGTKDYAEASEIIKNKNINNTTIVAIKAEANISTVQLESFNYFEYFVYDSEGNLITKSELIEKQPESTTVPSAMFLISDGTVENVNDDSYLARGNKYYIRYYAYKTDQRDGKYPIDEDNKSYWDENVNPQATILKQEANVIMYPSTSDNTSITYKYKMSDIDNSIIKENNNKYFYQYCAGVPIYEKNKKELKEGTNTEDTNGYWTVKFDNIPQEYLNYNLEAKILQSLQKGGTPLYRTLTSQKFAEVLNDINVGATVTENNGISAQIELNNLSTADKSKIVKIKIELIDRAQEIPNIEIERSAKELSDNEWKININYLDLIYQNATSIKDKIFDITIKTYYINGRTGYDISNENIVYQTNNGENLRLYETTMEFIKIDGNQGQTVLYQKHNYIFEEDKVVIQENGRTINWLNYSSNGLTRQVETDDNVAILPREVSESTTVLTDSIKMQNVIPGIKPSTDMTITPKTNSANIKISQIYNKDAIGTLEDVFIELYSYDNNLLIEQKKLDTSNGTNFENLQKGTRYYFKVCLIYNNEKYYLYDMEQDTNDINYEFETLDEIRVTVPIISYIKKSSDEKRLLITHSANIKNGYKGFEYEICDQNGNPITETIAYSLDNVNFRNTEDGKFTIDLEYFSATGSNFGNVYINVNRNTFFEYDTVYTIKITPLVSDDAGNISTIGNTISTQYSYAPIAPETSVYARRVENPSGDPYITFNVSVSDDDYLIANEVFEYKIYQNGDKNPIKQSRQLINNYAIIRVDKNDSQDFDFKNTYKIDITFEKYLKNRTDDQKETITVSKTLPKIENEIDVGTVSWSIENNAQIKLKFYDSYNLNSVKGIKCSIYDVNGRIVKNVPTIENVYIEDNTSDATDPHKSIVIQPNYIFEKSKSYMISVRFLDETGKIIGSFEPENPVMNK